MKQRLGQKKHKKCEVIAGKAYLSCYAGGHYGHGQIECWWSEHDADWVALDRGTVTPKIRQGQSIDHWAELRQLVSVK